MKFNIAVEYDPNEDWESFDEVIKREVAEQISYRIMNELGAGYKTTFQELAKGIKKSIVNELIKEYAEIILTDGLREKVQSKVEAEINKEFVSGLSKKVMKDVEPKINQMVKTEANKATEKLRKDIANVFKLT